MENLVIPTPEFSLKLPISGHTIRYRPFLVREEKLMLTLKEAKDADNDEEFMEGYKTFLATEFDAS